MTNRSRVCTFAVTLLLATSGASCPRRVPTSGPLPPVAFVQQPTLPQVVQTVHGNTERVRQLQARDATLQVSGLPAMSASLALQRPRNLRLQAGLGITGTELDVGSNDELFWMWAKRSDPPALYFGRHRDVGVHVENPVFPVPPTWLIEALGLVQFDSYASLEGPYLYAGGNVAVRIPVANGSRSIRKTIIVDGQYGFVVEVHVHDQSGQLLAAAALSHQAYDAHSGVTMPREVKIRLPLVDMTLTLRAKGYDINQLGVDPRHLWSLPEMSGVPLVDIASAGRLDPPAFEAVSTQLPP